MCTSLNIAQNQVNKILYETKYNKKNKKVNDEDGE